MLETNINWQEISHFISSLLNSKFIITILTSWPSAIVIIVLLLRKGILDKLRQLDSFNYKDGTAKFIRDTLDQVKTNQTLSTEDNSNQLENDSEYEDMDEPLEHPVSAVLEYWFKVEEVINEVYESLSGSNHTDPSKGEVIPVPKAPKAISTTRKIDFLAGIGVIDKWTKSSLHDLRKIRNQVAHGAKIDKKYASVFTALCKDIVQELKSKTL